MKLLLFLVPAAAAVAFAVWTYGRRELPVAGRWMPATLRAAALVLVLLLLVDPYLPAVGTGPELWVLVDGSASMAIGSPGGTPWDSARTRADLLRADGARVLRFGELPAALPADSALLLPPADPHSRLVPALERAAEAGARDLVVISDFRVEDPVAAGAALARLGMGARFVGVGGEVRNAGIAGLALPADLESGEPVRGELTVFSSGADAGDTIALEIREEGRLVWSGRAPAPAPGRVERIGFVLPPSIPDPTTGGEVRYEARLGLVGDSFAADDEAVAYGVVDPREGVLFAVSLAPDWELRHLIPLFARVTGLPTRGFLRFGGRFLSTEPGTGSLSEQEVADRVGDARLLILHGLGAGAPDWARTAAARAPRVLVFARDAEGAAAVGIATGGPRAGEWYLDAEPPPSPLAGELSGPAYAALPPLLELLPVALTEPGSGPLEARLQGSGPARSTLLLRERAGGRAAVALASGWWRWALRPGADEEAYARVWSAVAGWLLRGDAAPPARVRPVTRVVEGGTPIAWTSGGVVPIRVTVFGGDRVVTDTTLAEPVASLRTPPLTPGSYRYLTRAGPDSATGRFDVRGTSSELRHARMELPDPIAVSADADSESAGRALRAHPAPWLILVALLCAEWVTRRRKGLR